MMSPTLTALFGAGLAVLLQVRAHEAFPVFPDLGLIALVVIGPFLGFAELFAVTAFALWVINWQPGMSVELALFAGLPFILAFREKVFPWQPWFSNLAAVAAAPLLFYAMFVPSVSAALSYMPGWIIGIAFGAVLYGAMAESARAALLRRRGSFSGKR